VLQVHDPCNKAVLADVRRAWFAVSLYSSAHGLQGQEAPRDRARLIHPQDRANSVVVRIQPVRRAWVVIRRVQEWVQGRVLFHLLLADRRVRVGQRAVRASRTFPGKKKGR
jgi:hypothetical protein